MAEIFGVILGLLLIAYLLFAILRPEKF